MEYLSGNESENEDLEPQKTGVYGLLWCLNNVNRRILSIIGVAFARGVTQNRQTIDLKPGEIEELQRLGYFVN